MRNPRKPGMVQLSQLRVPSPESRLPSPESRLPTHSRVPTDSRVPSPDSRVSLRSSPNTPIGALGPRGLVIITINLTDTLPQGCGFVDMVIWQLGTSVAMPSGRAHLIFFRQLTHLCILHRSSSIFRSSYGECTC
jgi:hypothetical protein